MKKLLLGIITGVSVVNATAQELSIDAMIRPRFEYRNGFQDVALDGAEGSAFVSQRSSLLVGYKDSKISAFLDFQDVSVWGDRPQLARDGGDTFRVNQAWAEIQLGKGWSTKVGRQTISYDDQRIFGALGWAQQQRTHDAGILRYKTSSLKLDAGFAFNQNAERNADGGQTANGGNIFVASGPAVPLFQYKAMQYLHVNNKFSDNFSGSFLFINNTFQDVGSESVAGVDTAGLNSRQTTGVYGDYKQGKFGLTGSAYYQFGEVGSNELSAFQASLNGTYKVGETLKLIGLGAEILSGDDNGTDDGEIDSFFPLFGTNHKFNGYQDFFFVGRHANTVGLIDVNAKAVFKTGKSSSFIPAIHYFSAAKTPSGVDSYLGTAIDLVFKQKINSYANVIVGYSQSFLDSDFADGRAGGEADDIQNWGWVMLTIKPNLFKWKKPVAEPAK